MCTTVYTYAMKTDKLVEHFSLNSITFYALI